MKKFKIFLALIVLILSILIFSTLKHDKEIEHDIDMLKKDLIAGKIKECLKDSEKIVQQSLVDVKTKCKEEAEKWWSEANIMNDAEK